MSTRTIITQNERETVKLAKKIARRLKGGDILLLQGELGSGKTTFAQGLAQALGVRERIKSPTFVLMHVHRVAHRLQTTDYRKYKSAVVRRLYAVDYFVHVDAYRVKNARELKEVGLMDWLGRPDTLTVVEWGEKIKPLLRGKRYFTIQFQHGNKNNERLITPPHLPLT